MKPPSSNQLGTRAGHAVNLKQHLADACSQQPSSHSPPCSTTKQNANPSTFSPRTSNSAQEPQVILNQRLPSCARQPGLLGLLGLLIFEASSDQLQKNSVPNIRKSASDLPKAMPSTHGPGWPHCIDVESEQNRNSHSSCASVAGASANE